MKYLTALLSGVVFVVLLSFLASPFLNAGYISYHDIQPGPDGETQLIDFLIYIQWPIFFVVGAVLGGMMHNRFLTRN
ncbi:MAG: hypothetical protein COA42_18185 [Alteromonadaceae bacterium]|nr:MAG: hypothetical protein COA42_18185 [Alteromonadaceae bacterium]